MFSFHGSATAPVRRGDATSASISGGGIGTVRRDFFVLLPGSTIHPASRRT
ncbi:MAG: hypothetical protein U0234_22955 [Sandaracinus sp.]